jgi:DNA-binding response OmpR family regulator
VHAAAREVFRHGDVEALVVDVNLPGISRSELLELLLPDVADRPEIAGAVREGLVTRFLRKLFDVNAPVRAVHAAIEAHQLGHPAPGELVQTIGPLEIDRARCSVAVGGTPLRLTPTDSRRHVAILARTLRESYAIGSGFPISEASGVL